MCGASCVSCIRCNKLILNKHEKGNFVAISKSNISLQMIQTCRAQQLSIFLTHSMQFNIANPTNHTLLFFPSFLLFHFCLFCIGFGSECTSFTTNNILEKRSTDVRENYNLPKAKQQRSFLQMSRVAVTNTIWK